MKELFLQYAAYNVWANHRLVECLQDLPEEMLTKEFPGSFPSLHLTLLHIWDAESIWWQRIRLQEHVSWPSASFKGNTRDLGAALLHQGRLWHGWVQNASEAALQHVFQYYNTKRELFKQPVYQVLLQLFNHSTYHRGQLVSLLRQAGMQKIPNTDYITWSRSRK